MTAVASKVAVAALLIVVFAPAGWARARQQPAAAPTRLSFTVTDSALRGPTIFTAGMTTLQLTNRGRKPHLMQLVRIAPGHTAQEALDSLRANRRLPSWTAAFIGVGPLDPGLTASVSFSLEPLEYLLADLLGGPDSVPHFLAGVTATLKGRGAAVGRSQNLEAAGGLMLTDRAFRFGILIRSGNTWTMAEMPERSTQLTSGLRTIRLDAAGASQQHSIVLARGGPEVMRQYGQWLEGRRPTAPPLLGGVPGMPPGQRAYLQAPLRVGSYVLFCTARHSRYGMLGFESGEFAQFVVR